MIEKITLKDFLSYGEVTKPSPFSSSAKVTTTLEMRPLNVLVGPNASGKSNFVEALALLRAAPKDLPLPIRNGGGVAEWIRVLSELRRLAVPTQRALFPRVVRGHGHVSPRPGTAGVKTRQ